MAGELKSSQEINERHLVSLLIREYSYYTPESEGE